MTTILVIEDEHLLRENLLNLLDFEGFEALEAADGKQGLELAQRHQPDLVICDIAMPVMDGFEVLDHLRSSPETAEIPLIFLTARAGKKASRFGLERGAVHYIVKPFTFTDLIDAIHTCVG